MLKFNIHSIVVYMTHPFHVESEGYMSLSIV